MAITLGSGIFQRHWLINQPLSQSIREFQQQRCSCDRQMQLFSVLLQLGWNFVEW